MTEQKCAVEGCDRFPCMIVLGVAKRVYGAVRRAPSVYCKRHEPRICPDSFCYRAKQDKPDAKWCAVHQAQATRASGKKARMEARRQETLEAGDLQANYTLVARYEITLTCPVDGTVIDAFDTVLDAVPMGGVKVSCPGCMRQFRTPRHYFPGSLTAPQPERNHGTG